MSDAEEATIMVVCAGFGVFVLATVLYAFSSGREPSGFQVFPVGGRGWVGYAIRTLIVAVLCSAILVMTPHTRSGTVATLLSLGVLLVAASAAFFRTDRAVTGIGFVIGIVGILVVLLFPEISV